MKTLQQLFFLGILAVLISSCDKDDDSERRPLDIPQNYDSTNFTANTAVQRNVLAQLSNLVSIAKAGRASGTAVDNDDLQEAYTSGSPSLKDLSTEYHTSQMEGANGFINQLALASGNLYTPGETQSQGGVYAGYLFDEYGLELEQMIEKGQFGAVLYQHAIDLMSQDITATTVDQVLAIFGSNPAFPNTNNPQSTPTPDTFMATYAARRDNNDGTGLYFQMKHAFIKLKAAAAEGEEYNKERDEAIAQIKSTWEKVNAATVVNYCHSATDALNDSDPDDSQVASGLHALGEAIGFIYGWRGISANAKLITLEEIDEILLLLQAPADGQAAVYTFVTEAEDQLPNLQQAINKLQNIYGFTDADIESFRQNWVSLQGR